MESKIRVEYDFDKKEPYIQLYLEKGSSDMRDGMLQHLIEQGLNKGLEVIYPISNEDNGTPQIRIKHTLDLNWVGLNAKCLKDINPNFKVGQSYNLLMATGPDHRVFVQGSGHIVRSGDMMEFSYLFEFAQAWEITDIGKFDLGETKETK